MAQPSSLPSYIPIPSSAIPIPSPSAPSTVKTRARQPSFPPSSAQSSAPAPTSRKFTVPTTASISTNVSDLLLSSLLPPNLPKLPANAAQKGGTGSALGRVRDLSTQRETLSLPLVSNNFRRFITKVGPVFWLQDRVEEVLFWRKPRWTIAWMLLWTFTCFQPRILLLLPSLILILLLLHVHERNHSFPSLLGVFTPTPTAGTVRVNPSPNPNSTATFSASTVPDGTEGGAQIPVVPPKEAESGVDYYMNLQAIQNLMGLVSDMYDWTTPRLTALAAPSTSTSPTSFPLTTTHLMLLLLPPTLLLPLTPHALVPYLLLPLGLAPPLAFHPNLTPSLLTLHRHPQFLKLRSIAEDWALTDTLPDEVGRKDISRVQVWENERLDPATGTVKIPPSWSSRNLRAGERAPWVKVIDSGSLWKEDAEVAGDADKGDKMVLALKDGWEWVPGAEWRVDVCGLWSEVGTDEDGWVYTDDSWQSPSTTAVSEGDAVGTGLGIGKGDISGMPGIAMRRVTRRRRWWRRVCKEADK
ncbi:integral peroxisomal membrane peroxin-domain-containing protein [Naematelia encephala]|uniref:Integral peroxisomal membrane peroxin-domain-containing protein n=1 Tax=Naematelia encephala TaxID=71784 RepID=A0A1Y2B0Y9_9TREE|nr:integral peroxisomal membrane peroxin-domain-containing protein [Naematelia encephala]